MLGEVIRQTKNKSILGLEDTHPRVLDELTYGIVDLSQKYIISLLQSVFETGK